MAENKSFEVAHMEDNQYLGPLIGRGFLIGFVDEVNGPGAKEVYGSHVTAHELLQIVKYWEKVVLDIRTFSFVTGQSGSSEFRRVNYAQCRINRIEKLLGQKQVQEAIDVIAAEFSKRLGPELWDIFLHGDSAQWEAVQSKTQAELESDHNKNNEKCS